MLNKHLLWAVCLCTSLPVSIGFGMRNTQSSHQAHLMPCFWGTSKITIPKRGSSQRADTDADHNARVSRRHATSYRLHLPRHYSITRAMRVPET